MDKSPYIILIGIATFLVLVFIFRKNIKKAGFKILFFEGSIETHDILSAQAPISSRVQKITWGRENLRLINEIETGKSIKDLPPGIYGYDHASCVDSALKGNGKMDLTNLQKTNWYFEIRKTANDNFLVGYISKDALSKIGRGKSADLNIFAKPWNEFKNKIAVPFSAVTNSSARTIDTHGGDIRILEIVTKRAELLSS